jgi:hypothetical protein
MLDFEIGAIKEAFPKLQFWGKQPLKTAVL